jgi:hypothetical protein
VSTRGGAGGGGGDGSGGSNVVESLGRWRVATASRRGGKKIASLTRPRSAWIGLSSSVILFNKWILDTLNFRKSSSAAAATGDDDVTWREC